MTSPEGTNNKTSYKQFTELVQGKYYLSALLST